MHPFPFAAIVGQETAVRSLLFHALDPRLGGALLLGHRGCAKSTLARAFGALLAELPGPEAGRPFVEIPLGVSEDRLLGSVDAGSLLGQGRWIAQNGLLESAHGGVLYVDEINLLTDSLADLLLDCAASGVYRMERDGFSRTIPSRFILIGTMNPEEGDLRPQLSDRFAHGVRIQSPADSAERMEIARRALDFEEDPEHFRHLWEPQQLELRERIQTAKAHLREVWIPEAMRLEIAERAHSLGLEGMRAELAVLRTIRAAAAWEKIASPTPAQVEEAWEMCLGHRPVPGLRSRTPPAPPQPTPLPPPSAPPSPKSSSSETSGEPSAPLFPKTAAPDPIPLARSGDAPPALPEASKLSLPPPGRRFATTLLRSQQGYSGGAEPPPPPSRTLWHASLVRSLLRGWRAGEGGWHWIRAHAPKVRRVWIFLDASRSTGGGGSLAHFRRTLAGCLPRAAKIRFLLLHADRFHWVDRDASADSIQKTLATLASAAGGSPLGTAIQKLKRDIQRTGTTSCSQIFFCSDGLPQPNAGQTPVETRTALTRALRKLCRLLPAGNVFWFAPPGARAQAGWLRKLLSGTGVLLQE